MSDNVRKPTSHWRGAQDRPFTAVVGARGAQKGRALSGWPGVLGEAGLVDHGKGRILCKQRVKAKRSPRGGRENKIRGNLECKISKVWDRPMHNRKMKKVSE